MATHKSGALQSRFPERKDPGSGQRPKLAVVGTGGLAYSRGRICAASIRGGFDVDSFYIPAGDYVQLLSDPSSELSQFNPNVVLILVDAACVPARRRPHVTHRRAKHDFAATVFQRALLPMLHLSCDTNAHRAPEMLAFLLKASENAQSAGGEHDEVQLALTATGRCGEVLIGCQVAPFWKRGKRGWLRNPVIGSGIGGLFAALFGLTYTSLVVDTGSHPWMIDAVRDIPCFLSRWSQDEARHRSLAEQMSPTCPDLFFFIDGDPFSIR